MIGPLCGVSSLYLTAPVGVKMENFFLNCCAKIELNAFGNSPCKALNELWGIIRKIEKIAGKKAVIPHRMLRPVDIDILLAGNEVINTPELTIPHPRLEERPFFLEGILEIAPHALLPPTEIPIHKVLQKSGEKCWYMKIAEGSEWI